MAAVPAPTSLASGNAPILSVEGVTKRFGGLTALSEVGFSIAKGEIYGLVALTGDPARVKPADLDGPALHASFAANFEAPILLARACAEEMSARSTKGAIVLVSSMQGVHPFEGSLAYAGPKAALVHAARILAKEHGGAADIRVNVVAPGATSAGMARASIDRVIEEVRDLGGSASADIDTANDIVSEEELYVVDERTIAGKQARILSDGTVEAETDEGWMRFENVDHLQEYMDAVRRQRGV